MGKPLPTVHFDTRGGARLDFTRLGFGGASLAPYPDTLAEGDAAALVETAWDLGIRYFDTAPFYGFGKAERRLGAGLAGRPRSEFLLSTKVGRLLKPNSEAWQDTGGGPQAWPLVYDYSYDAVMRSFQGSLARLGVDRVDIAYVHDIDAKVHGGRDIAEARTRELIERGGWRALDELRTGGALKAIGVGVNEWEP